MLENCSHDFVRDIVGNILDIFPQLIQSEFGTFVLCSTLDNASDEMRVRLLEIVLAQIETLIISRDGSKILENCISKIG